MTTPIFHSFNELQLGPAMAQTQAGPVAISESSIQGDPVIRYQLRTTASSRVQTTDIPGSIDSTSLRFRFIKRLSNKHVEFHGNGFVVTFRNKITRKTCCDCSNAVPCSHIYWALNQFAKTQCRQQTIKYIRAILRTDANHPDRQVSIEIGNEDVWPLIVLDQVGLTYANQYIHERLLDDEKQETVEADLFGHNRYIERQDGQEDRRVLVCADRPIYAATYTALEPIIAEACVLDPKLADQFRAVFTPARQAAIKLEDIKVQADREFAALTDLWHYKSTGHHERLVKRTLNIYANDVYDVYRILVNDPSTLNVDTSQASYAAASTLIHMMEGVVDRTITFPPSNSSLWREFTQKDYKRNDPGEFWTLAFLTFELILHRGDFLSDHHEEELINIYRRARENPPSRPIPRIISELHNIIRVSRERKLQ